MEQKGRCVHCRTEISVPDSYADGDHIKCGACGTQHRLIRSAGALRLVIADVAPLREEVHANEQRLARLENELGAARGSLGIGVNGLGIGVIYVLWKLVREEQDLTQGLIITAAAIGVACGLLFELANFLFLAKRKLLNQLNGEIEALRVETTELQRKIREASVRK